MAVPVGPAYRYRVELERVIDGDTVVFSVDLGFHAWLRGVHVRLVGINARESEEPGGPQARDNLAALLAASGALTLTSVGPDKYGDRWLGRVQLSDGSDVATALIADGWAAPWIGRGAKPVPPWPRPTTTTR